MGKEMTTFYKCPKCMAYNQMNKLKHSVTDGNIRWSDWFAETTTDDSLPVLFKCWKCDDILWSSELSYYTTHNDYALLHEPSDTESLIEYFDDDNVFFYADVDIANYQQMIRKNVFPTINHEIALRIYLLWEYNMQFRFAADGTPAGLLNPEGDMADCYTPNCNEEVDGSIQENMLCLIKLLKNSKGTRDTIIRAEVLRELGHFDEAVWQMAHVKVSTKMYPIGEFRKWCLNKCSHLRCFAFKGKNQKNLLKRG